MIAATHRNLEADVAAGRFRADLHYRLSVFPIHVPSLRDRAEDIPQLVWFFIHRNQRELGRRITKVPPSVMDALTNYSWPGNVRELENVVERAMIASMGDTLQLDDALPFSGRCIVASSLRTTSTPFNARTSRTFSNYVVGGSTGPVMPQSAWASTRTRSDSA